jgi:hypothetical protein
MSTLLLSVGAFMLLFVAFALLRPRACTGDCSGCAQHCKATGPGDHQHE